MDRLTVNDIPPELARALAKAVRDRGQSMDQTVKALLAQALGLSELGHDNGLGKFAGTWTEDDLREFERAVGVFEQVDAEQWE